MERHSRPAGPGVQGTEGRVLSRESKHSRVSQQWDHDGKKKQTCLRHAAPLPGVDPGVVPASPVAGQEKNAKVEEKQPLETEEILSIKERLDLRDFRDAHPDLDTEDIVEINKVAKANNLKLDEALSLPIVKGYLNNKQEQKKIETATIEINRAPKGADNKPLFYEGQSDEEFKKNWLQYMSKQT